MKRQYMKPETEVSMLTSTTILTSSIVWDVQHGEGGKVDGVDEDEEPNPGSGAGAKEFNLWDEDEDDWE